MAGGQHFAQFPHLQLALTDADRASQRYIVAGLNRRFPSLVLLSPDMVGKGRFCVPRQRHGVPGR